MMTAWGDWKQSRLCFTGITIVNERFDDRLLGFKGIRNLKSPLTKLDKKMFEYCLPITKT